MTLTPKLVVTPALVALNGAVFLAMIASGIDPLNPSAERLLAWGANHGPRIALEPWRLVSSMFLHIGALHLVMNMWVLWSIGQLLERMMGPLGFVTLYFCAGVGGSLASVAWNTQVVSAGASGAIFGVYGALGAFLLRYRDSVPPAALRRLRGSTMVFVLFNVLYGLKASGIDMAAHLGGLVAGLIAGLFLTHELSPASREGHERRAAVTAIVGAAVLLAALMLLPRVPDLQTELALFAATEAKVLGIHGSLMERSSKAEISGPELALAVEKQILPPWRASRARLLAIPRARGVQQKALEILIGYAETRERAWTLLLEGTRSGDLEKVKRAQALQDSAGEAVRELQNLKP